MITKFDEEIHEVEERLAREREALVHQAEDLGHTAREAAISPKGLLAAAAVGFMFAELTRSRRPSGQVVVADANGQVSRKLGVGGLLGGAALAIIKAKYGSPGALSRAAWEFAAAQRARRSDASVSASSARTAAPGAYAPAPRLPVVPPATPPVP